MKDRSARCATNLGPCERKENRRDAPIPCLRRAIPTRIPTKSWQSTKSRKAKPPKTDATNLAPISAAPNANLERLIEKCALNGAHRPHRALHRVSTRYGREPPRHSRPDRVRCTPRANG